MLWLSFHAPGKTCCKMLRIVREMCVHIGKSQEKSENVLSDFLWVPWSKWLAVDVEIKILDGNELANILCTDPEL